MAQISVIVTVYNMLDVLERCVDSVLAQTFTDFELILVDDGSTDGSGALCDRLNGTDSRIRVVHTENHGVSAARKAGASVAKATWVMFVDADDTLPPDSLKCLSANAFDDIDIVLGNAYCYTPTGRFALSREMSVKVTGTEFADMLFRNAVPDKLCGLIMRRSLIDLGSWLTPKAVTPCEEQVTLLRAALKASNVIVDNSVFVYEYHNETESDTDAEPPEMTTELWEGFFGRMHHLFDTVHDLSEGFFLFRLRQVYSSMLLQKVKMQGKDGELSRLKAEAKQYRLCGHDKMILKMLRDPVYRSINLRKFAPPESHNVIEVGIVLCVRNARKKVLSAIRRALSQTEGDALEVIVVDNASDDNTAEIVQSVRAINPRVHLVTMPEPTTVEQCRLAGLRRSIARYVMFADVDYRLRRNGIESLLRFDDSEEGEAIDQADMIVGQPRRYTRLLGVPLASDLLPFYDDSNMLNMLRRVELLSRSDTVLFSRTRVGDLMERYVESVPDDAEADFLNTDLRFNLKMALWMKDVEFLSDSAQPVAKVRDAAASAKAIKRDYAEWCNDLLHVVYSLKAVEKATEENCAAVAQALSARFMSTLSLLLASPLFPTEKAKIWLEEAFDHDVWRILAPVLPDNMITLYESADNDAIIVQALNDLHSRRSYFYLRRLF